MSLRPVPALGLLLAAVLTVALGQWLQWRSETNRAALVWAKQNIVQTLEAHCDPNPEGLLLQHLENQPLPPPLRAFVLPMQQPQWEQWHQQPRFWRGGGVETIDLSDGGQVVLVPDDLGTIALLVLVALGCGGLLAGLLWVWRREDHRHTRALAGLVALHHSERRELARDLHDDLGPSLFAIHYEAAAMGRVADHLTPAETNAHTGLILKQVDDVQKLLHRVLTRLRPVALAHEGLVIPVERLLEEWRCRFPDVRWELLADHYKGGIPLDRVLCLYRVVQDVLIMAAHGAATQHVAVILDQTPLIIQCLGSGLSAGVFAHVGHLGMAERVALVDGTLLVEDLPQGGIQFTVQMPAS